MPATRRQFLRAGAALYVGFQWGGVPSQAQVRAAGPALPAALRTHPQVDAWLRIGSDDRVTLFSGKAELGQGLKTALVQLAAEELDVAPSQVDVVVADTARTPNESYTAGSRSIQDSGLSIRQAAAEARHILLGIAAARFNVPASELQVDQGRITHAAGHRTRYGELVDGAPLQQAITGTAPLKDRARYRLVGTSLPRVDLPAKVFGGAPAFIQDLRLEGMLHARVVHPPTQSARLAAIDIEPVRRLPGVQQVLRDGSLLGVIATREEQAIAAATELARRARWEQVSTQALPDDAALPAHMRAQPVRAGSVARRGAVAESALPQRASYFRPFQAHASIGPSCALALFKEGQLQVWSHTQGIYPLRVELSRVLGLPESAIRTISEESAGCYGQNGADDAAVEAAMLAMAMPGRPIRLQWSREDEFGWEPLGAAMLVDCEASLEGGRISAWRSVVRGYPNTARPGFGGGNGANLLAAQLRAAALPPRDATNAGLNRNAEPLYDIPALQVDEQLITQPPVRVSSLRTLGAYANVFAVESFMDELAVAAGADPLAFRLAHLTDPRARAVLEAAATAAGWQQRARLPRRHGLGIGYARYSSSSTYCAVVAEVAVAEDGTPRAHRIWAAADCGPIVSPDGVRNQIAGGAMQATSWTLLESVRLRHASRGLTNWHEYPILRFADAPMIEVTLIDRPDQPLVGPGEASLGPTAAALANAVFAATGARVRSLPLTAGRVKGATPS